MLALGPKIEHHNMNPLMSNGKRREYTGKLLIANTARVMCSD